jgi:hypothetical protein
MPVYGGSLFHTPDVPDALQRIPARHGRDSRSLPSFQPAGRSTAR